MLVRWIGAFGKGSSLAEALRWEIAQANRELAAERIEKSQGGIKHASVGLWIESRACVRYFRGDVWSKTDEATGRLVATRKPVRVPGMSGLSHTECFVKPGYVRALVVKRSPGQIRLALLSALADVAMEFGLPIVWLQENGKRINVTREVMKALNR